MNRDRIAALVALVAAVLAGTGLPERLGMTPQAVTIVGGLVVGVAAVGRAIVEMFVAWRVNLARRVRGEEPLTIAPNWRDIVGALFGVVAIGLGIDGVAVDQIDPNALAGLSSIAAAAFAWQRGGGGGPTPPTTTGLVLLVLGCTPKPAKPRECLEWAELYSRDGWSGTVELHEACVEARRREHEAAR